MRWGLLVAEGLVDQFFLSQGVVLGHGVEEDIDRWREAEAFLDGDDAAFEQEGLGGRDLRDRAVYRLGDGLDGVALGVLVESSGADGLGASRVVVGRAVDPCRDLMGSNRRRIRRIQQLCDDRHIF